MPPRRVDSRAFEMVTRQVASAFSSRILMVVRAAVLKAQPHPSITSRRSDAYHGQIGNGLGNVIDIVPAFAIRRAIRDSAMACCRRLLCANVIKFGGIRPTWVGASMRAILGSRRATYRVVFGDPACISRRLSVRSRCLWFRKWRRGLNPGSNHTEPMPRGSHHRSRCRLWVASWVDTTPPLANQQASCGGSIRVGIRCGTARVMEGGGVSLACHLVCGSR